MPCQFESGARLAISGSEIWNSACIQIPSGVQCLHVSMLHCPKPGFMFIILPYRSAFYGIFLIFLEDYVLCLMELVFDGTSQQSFIKGEFKLPFRNFRMLRF